MSTLQDFQNFLAQVRKETGIDAITADMTGLVTISVDDHYNLSLQYIEATGKVLCFIEVATLPHDAPKAVYRDLLVGCLFGKDTAGGYFAVEPESETVVYNYFFDLEKAAADTDDFVATLEKILQLCDIWSERIRRVLAGDTESSSAAPVEMPLHHMIRA